MTVTDVNTVVLSHTPVALPKPSEPPCLHARTCIQLYYVRPNYSMRQTSNSLQLGTIAAELISSTHCRLSFIGRAQATRRSCQDWAGEASLSFF